MNTKDLERVLAWMKTTDLVELGYRGGKESFELRLEGGAARPPEAAPSFCALVAAPSPGVGVFRWGPPGARRRAEEGTVVAAGELLGLVETGDKPIEVRAPSAGRIVQAPSEEGRPVQYGQPLFLIAP